MEGRTRWQNVRHYMWKGFTYSSFPGLLGAGASLGIFYAIKYVSYHDQLFFNLVDENGCGWTVSDKLVASAICPDNPELSNRIDSQSAAYGAEHARFDLAMMSPALTAPWVVTGMVAGAIYGAFQPVRRRPQDIQKEIQENNRRLLEKITIEDEDPDCPDDFIDIVSSNLMKDPQILDCGHNFDLTTLERLLEKKEACRCPLCRTPFGQNDYQADNGLHSAIQNYLATKNASPSKIGIFAIQPATNPETATRLQIETTTERSPGLRNT
ncbi:MAG: hypothetical protein JO149_05655 [Gammaproteobacteria bacterium]|nr:hypothetical protein [Gammaproteobacteria bacterium]